MSQVFIIMFYNNIYVTYIVFYGVLFIYCCTLSYMLVGQKFRSSLAVWIWLRASHEVQSDVSQGCPHLKNLLNGEFPGSPVVRTRHFHCCGLGSIPGWGTKILQASCTAKKKKLLNGARESVSMMPHSHG